MADGSITFSTELDNSGIQKDLNAAKREIDKATKSLRDSEAAKLPLVEQVKELGALLDEAKAKLHDFQKQQASADYTLNNPSPDNPEPFIEAWASKPELDASVAEQSKRVGELEKQWDSINDKIDEYDQKIAKANNTIAEQRDKAGNLSAQLLSGAKDSKSTEKATHSAATNAAAMANATEKASVSAERFRKRIVGIVKQVFLFSLVSKALSATVDYMGKALKSNEQFTAELARLKAALLTAFQPIYETVVPALIALMQVATKVAQGVAQIFALISGKSASEYAAKAKALYEQAEATEAVGDAAEKAKKSLAGFDEINTLSSSNNGDTSTDSSAVPDFSDFETDGFKKKIDELTVYISGACLVLGLILLLSGASIPLGLGLLVVGAAGLASEIAVNWETVKGILQEQSTAIAAISGILLAIGLILTISGAAIPLGIGLIAVGAAGLAAVAAVNWESISEALQGPIGAITAATAALLLAIGLVLVFTGAALPLGIGLIAAGAAGLATVAAVNWNSIVEALRGPVGTVTAIASGAMLALGIILCCVGIFPLGIALIAAGAAGLVTVTAVNWNAIEEALTTAFKGAINAVIKLINGFLGWLNDIFHIRWDAIVIAGVEVMPAIDKQLLSFDKIPLLAKGAVLPANKPFMAVVGDQKHGTNVEAPLATIQEAVAIVMEDMIRSNAAGHEATIAVLREILEAVLGIHIGDDVIGQAVARYNAKLAIIKGGV